MSVRETKAEIGYITGKVSCEFCGAEDEHHHSFSCPTGLHPDRRERQPCLCNCKDGGPCGHEFDGPVVYTENSGSVTCKHCGMAEMSHDMKLF